MKEIFHVLTPRHFSRGFSLFFRAHFGFLSYSFYTALILLTGFHSSLEGAAAVAERMGLPQPAGAVGLTLLLVSVIYAIGFFPIRACVRRGEEKWDSRNLRAQFGILSRVARLGQSAFVLFLAGIIWLSFGREMTAFLLVLVLTMVMAGVSVLSIAIHGWMWAQLDGGLLEGLR